MWHNIYLPALGGEARTSNSSVFPSRPPPLRQSRMKARRQEKRDLFITATWIIYLAEFALSHVIDCRSFLETVRQLSLDHRQEGGMRQLIIQTERTISQL